MYELFVLGELMDQPLHGYVLREVINLAIGPLRQMSWGALYPLIRQLEHSGYIVPDADTGDGISGRQRKVYRITEAGRQRFLSLMLRTDEYNADYPDLFNLKLSKFDRLTPPQQMTVLQHYQGYVLFLHDHLQRGRHYVSTNPQIPEMERPYILRAIEHRLHLAEADRAWVDAEIASLAGQMDREDAAAGPLRFTPKTRGMRR